MKKNVLYLLVLATMISSCRKEDPDTERPTINSVSINGSTSSVTVSAGSSLNFSIALSDNIALKQLKIDIHDNFDGHGHSPNIPFSTQRIYDLSGTSVTSTPSILIPSTAASGPYDIIISLIDASGNEAIQREIELTITQNGQAVIDITSPSLATEWEYSPGDTIFISGTISDDIDIEDIDISLENETTGAVLYDEEFEQTGVADVLWNFNELNLQSKWIIIPSGASLGHHGLVIKVTDNDANVTRIEIHVHVEL